MQSEAFGGTLLSLRQILQSQENCRFGLGYPLLQFLRILLDQSFVEHPLPLKFVLFCQKISPSPKNHCLAWFSPDGFWNTIKRVANRQKNYTFFPV